MMQVILSLSRLRLYRLCLLILSFGCLLSPTVPLQTVQAQSQPSLRLSHTYDDTYPSKFKVELFLDNPGLITAYEGSLLFDTTRIEYRGIEQPLELATRLRREAQLMADVHFEAGLSFGLFSPSIPNQTTRFANQSVRIATVYLKAEGSGSYQLALDNWRFVDAAGQTVAVHNDNAQFTVQIGDAPDSYPALQPAWHIQTADSSTPAQERLDLTGEGRVDLADAMELAVLWSWLRSLQRPCTLLEEAHYDLNSDGCVDIRDLQQLAANPSPPSSGALLTTPLTFVVNSTGDADDANKGDEICATAAGVCTLRAAIEEANRHSGPDRINFDIPAAQNAAVDIQVTDRLPIINDSSGGVIIDGYSQAGSQVNSQTIGGSNAVIRIQIRAQGHGREI